MKRIIFAGAFFSFVFFVFASPTHAIFRAVPAGGAGSQWTKRIIVKFRDWVTPDVIRVSQLNTQLGAVSMEPLFTVNSVGPAFVAQAPIGPSVAKTVSLNPFFSLFPKPVYAQAFGTPCGLGVGGCNAGLVCQNIHLDGDGSYCTLNTCPNNYPCGGGRPECEVNCRYTCAANGCVTTMLRQGPPGIYVNDATCAGFCPAGGTIPYTRPCATITSTVTAFSNNPGWIQIPGVLVDPGVTQIRFTVTGQSSYYPAFLDPILHPYSDAVTTSGAVILGFSISQTQPLGAGTGAFYTATVIPRDIQTTTTGFVYQKPPGMMGNIWLIPGDAPGQYPDNRGAHTVTAQTVCPAGSTGVPPVPPPIVGTSPFTDPELHNFYVIAFSSEMTTPLSLILDQYRALADVESVEPDLILEAQQAPNDPYYQEQWALEKIHAAQAWQQINVSSQLKIGVVDSGFERTHEDTSPLSLAAGRSYVTCAAFDQDGNCQTHQHCTKRASGYCENESSDENGHGTAVTGVIAALLGNGRGISGLSSHASIVPVKVLNADGETLSSWTIEGIVYAVNQGVKIINLSIAGCSSTISADGTCSHDVNTASTAFKKVLDYALKRNVTVVVAAGNNNDDAQWFTPPNYNNTPGTKGRVIVVGATGRSDERAFYSNYGSIVGIAAPGGNIASQSDRNGDGVSDTLDCSPADCILSTRLSTDSDPPRFSNANYESHMGTSLAVPHVVGVIGLLMTKNPSLKPPDIIDLMNQSADPITTDKPIGDKRINAASAIAQEPTAEVLYGSPVCDRCGWCDRAVEPKPANWDACNACLYTVDGRERKDRYYTQFGCWSVVPKDFVQSVLSIAFGISGGLAFLVFVSGSVLYVSSGGVSSRVHTARDMMTSSLLGLFVVVAGMLILRSIGFEILRIPGWG